MPRLAVDALGTTIDLVGDQSGLDEVARDWSRCLAATGEAAQVEVAVGQSQPGRPASVPWLASRLTREGIDRLAGRRLLFHACGLADERGRTIVMVGPSGAGKSTAASALCRSTFGYVSDETIAVDDDLSITPYPKPLLVREGTQWPKAVVGPDELSLRPCPPEVTASRIVLIHRDGTSPPRTDRVPLAEAILALVPETSALGRRATPLQDLCRLVDHCGGVHRLRYAEVSEADGLLARLLDQEAPMSDEWEAITSAPRQNRLGNPHAALRTSAVHDGVVIGEEVLLLQDGRPIHLRGIGATLWLALSHGHAEEDLLDTVVDAHGPHTQADRLVAEAIEEMEARGLLARLPADGSDA